LEDLEKKYKLDKPWPLNFATWLFDPSDTYVTGYDLSGNFITTTKGLDLNVFGLHIKGSGILTGDFGKSEGYARNTEISKIISDRWFETVLLVLTSLVLALAIGVPLGIFGALRHRSSADHMLTFFTLGGLSVPSFVLGLLFIIFLAVMPKALRDQHGWDWLPWLPAGGRGNPDIFWDRVRHLVLPAVTLAIPQIAWLSRYTRFAMLDVLRQDYIRAAWAKGLGTTRVIFKHALRNTIIPLITQLAVLLPALLSTAVAVETVFAYEGMGKAFYRALGGCLASVSMQSQDPPPCPPLGYFSIDYPFALVLLLFLVVIVAVSNLLADFLYVVADPRINYASDRERT
jgi:peptide/nickel transport system permease protein